MMMEFYASTMSETEAYDESFATLLMICQFQDFNFLSVA